MSVNIRAIMLSCLNDIGIFLEEEEDFDLREYIVESLQFVSYILCLEEALGIEIPDELLIYDKMTSFNGYCNAIESVYADNYKEDVL